MSSWNKYFYFCMSCLYTCSTVVPWNPKTYFKTVNHRQQIEHALFISEELYLNYWNWCSNSSQPVRVGINSTFQNLVQRIWRFLCVMLPFARCSGALLLLTNFINRKFYYFHCYNTWVPYNAMVRNIFNTSHKNGFIVPQGENLWWIVLCNHIRKGRWKKCTVERRGITVCFTDMLSFFCSQGTEQLQLGSWSGQLLHVHRGQTLPPPPPKKKEKKGNSRRIFLQFWSYIFKIRATAGSMCVDLR